MYCLRLHDEDTGSRLVYKTTWHHNPEECNIYYDIPWQCSRVGSLTPECEETNLSVFLLLIGSCDHTTIESVRALCFSHNIGIHKPNHPSDMLQLLSQKHCAGMDDMN